MARYPFRYGLPVIFISPHIKTIEDWHRVLIATSKLVISENIGRNEIYFRNRVPFHLRQFFVFAGRARFTPKPSVQIRVGYFNLAIAAFVIAIALYGDTVAERLITPFVFGILVAFEYWTFIRRYKAGIRALEHLHKTGEIPEERRFCIFGK